MIVKSLVSILIPAYNAEEWIADTLRSANAQTWPRKEIIVVDDGSTDKTLSVARQFESDSLRVVAQDHRGAASTRNMAYSLCHGEYIQWLDADDLLAPDKIECQMEVLEQIPSKRTLSSSAWARFIYRSHRAKFVPDALWRGLSPTEFLLEKMGNNLFMPNGGWLVTRELSELAGPWDTRQSVDDDGEYFCRVVIASDGIRFVPEAKAYYRAARSRSLSYIGTSDSKVEAQWRTTRLHVSYLRSLEESPRVREACLRFLQKSTSYFYPERPDIVVQVEELCRSLGGELKKPRLPWKYSWIERLAGWRVARHTQLLLPNLKATLLRSRDRALFGLESGFHYQTSQQPTKVQSDLDLASIASPVKSRNGRTNIFSESRISGGDEDLPVQPGFLDGITIMRYAHVSRTRASGGIEQYLRQLNGGLLQRHRLTIVQMHLVRDEGDHAVAVENVGLGRILWIPVAIRQADPSIVDMVKRVGYVYTQTLRQCRQQGKGEYYAALSSVHNLLRHHGGHLRHNATILGERLLPALEAYGVDLLVSHWLSYDTDVLLHRAMDIGIPFVLINHFDNQLLLDRRLQKWIPQAVAIGTVSGLGIPDSLRDQCVNLSDAIDTDFFSPEKARPMKANSCPIVLLPARIEHGKGHHDLLEAARILIARKVDFVICFAGAVDSEPLHQELRGLIAASGLENRILFLGEISAEEMRDWYAQSSVVVLPSNSEGLGRVLLEAQAMKKPVIAYESGGTREAVLKTETGFLLKTGNVEDLADKISFLLANESERLRIGERGREFVSRQFGISAFIRRHEVFYFRALSNVRTKRYPQSVSIS